MMSIQERKIKRAYYISNKQQIESEDKALEKVVVTTLIWKNWKQTKEESYFNLHASETVNWS